MIFKKGELFCGAGGLSLGAMLAEFDYNGEIFGIKHSWANDYNLAACETYRYNICSESPNTVINCDVRELDITKLEKIDSFVFNFPCDDFKVIDEKLVPAGNSKPLYSYGLMVLKYHQPKWFLAEINGLLNLAIKNEVLIQISKILEETGYVVTPNIYKFEEYGVPQSRRRTIIVGIRMDLGWKFKIPKPIHKELKDQKTSRQALEEPPVLDNAFNHECSPHNSKIVEMLSYIPSGENSSFEGIPEHLRLNIKGARLNSMYKRLHPDFPAYTVTGSGGGGTQIYHYSKNRALTNRERARLQTFPDDYYFFGSRERVRNQIGVATPPMGAKLIFEAILKSFAGIEYETVQSNCQK